MTSDQIKLACIVHKMNTYICPAYFFTMVKLVGKIVKDGFTAPVSTRLGLPNVNVGKAVPRLLLIRVCETSRKGINSNTPSLNGDVCVCICAERSAAC